MDIYDRIEVMLKRKRMNKKELCERTGISYNTLASLFKRRSKNVELETVKKIALCLDTTIEYLITGNETYLQRTEDQEISNNNIIVVTRNGDKIQYDLTEEEIQAVLTILDGMKKK